MLCVTTVKYMVVHNDYEIDLILSHRGQRRGDPLSP